MNRKMVFHTVGLMLIAEAALLLLPALVALIYGESCLWALLASAGIALVLGLLLRWLCRTDNQVIYAREGFVTTAMSWLALSAVGALPFTLRFRTAPSISCALKCPALSSASWCPAHGTPPASSTRSTSS